MNQFLRDDAHNTYSAIFVRQWALKMFDVPGASV